MNYFIKLITIFLLISPLIAKEPSTSNKHIILAQGGPWHPLLARNFIKNHRYIKRLPFSGFIMVGNSFTDLTMKQGKTLTYSSVWKELHALKNLYKKKKENFLHVNLAFPGDYWNDRAWRRVAKNFGIVARVAREIGFKGIAIDDEGYGLKNKKIVNFKFPTKLEVQKNPKKYKYWEKKGSNTPWVDKHSYRNPKYTFQEHMEKVTLRFQEIMNEIQKKRNFPNITILVYFGPSLAHINMNKEKLLMSYRRKSKQHEYKGPIFLGLKRGLKGNSHLHDMGENYKLRKDKHFKNSYLLRKYKLSTNHYNHRVNSKYHWKIPRVDRDDWSKRVDVGFIVHNHGSYNQNKEYDTRRKSTSVHIQQTLQKALKYSDKYVIYYCQDQDWLRKKSRNAVNRRWYNMMKKFEK